MNNLRISYLNISPYSRHSPSLQLKTELKKQSSSLERPKSSKISYAGATTRGQTPVNYDITERRYSPNVDRKGDLMSSLYQLAKLRQKEKPSTAKVVKTKDIPAKKNVKNMNKPSEKSNNRVVIYQYLQNKIPKKSEESKILHPSLQNTPSRQGSKSQFQEEKDYSQEKKKIAEGSILQQKKLIDALEDLRRSKRKSSSSTQNQTNFVSLLKSNQRSSQISTGRANQGSSPQISVVSVEKKAGVDRKKLSEPQKNELYNNLRLNMNSNDPSFHKEQINQEGEVDLIQKKHKRGFSSGQNLILIDQAALERERDRELEKERERERREKERDFQIRQMMEQYIKDPQQEEDEFFEEFFHMDKMTFDFERLIISQKAKQSQSITPGSSPLHNKQTISQSRTKSIEEPNSLLQTKSTSRWTTKRSSMEDFHHGARDNFNLIEQISDFDRT